LLVYMFDQYSEHGGGRSGRGYDGSGNYAVAAGYGAAAGYGDGLDGSDGGDGDAAAGVAQLPLREVRIVSLHV